MFIRLLEILLFLVAAYVIISQIIIPSIMNTPFFPFFKQKKHKLYQKKEELVSKNEELVEAELEEEIVKVDEKIKSKKKRQLSDD